MKRTVVRRRSPVALGVDRGGTWLRVAATDGRGRLLWREKRPTAPLAGLRRVLVGILRRRGVVHLSRLTVGSKGVWTQGERARWRRALRSLAAETAVVSDVELALEAVAPGGRIGVVLIAGTGSIALGRDGRGRLVRAGGLGPRRGDEGSGHWIGRESLRAGSGGVSRRILGRYDARSVAAVAARAKAVLARARRDRSCARIVARAQAHLAALVRRVAEGLGSAGTVTVGGAGGLMADRVFRSGVWRALKAAAPAIDFRFSTARRDSAVVAARWRASAARRQRRF